MDSRRFRQVAVGCFLAAAVALALGHRWVFAALALAVAAGLAVSTMRSSADRGQPRGGPL